ncbi:MAG: polyphosphate kinase 1 [bacterium]|nr:polyphosphate kinase 1 [Acidimicrobiia bacterium]MCY4649270.1 polyphosphate kinase 1 [bacterium]
MPPLETSPRVLNRELSWLDFNSRVLALSEQEEVPLLEKVRFLSIWASNLDEFFQVRVAGLKEQVAHGVVGTTPDGRTARQTLAAISAETTEQYLRASKTYRDLLQPALAEAGIGLKTYADLDDEEVSRLQEYFHDTVFPVLTPLAVDPAHPFPHISSLSLNLAIQVQEKRSKVLRFARVKIPPILPAFAPLSQPGWFVPLDEVIATHLDQLFPGMRILDYYPFRVTRNADFELEEDEGGDLLAAVESELTRRRFGRAVRLEVTGSMTAEVLDLLTRELQITESDVFVMDGVLNLADLGFLATLPRPELLYPPWTWVTHPRLAGRISEQLDFFEAIREGDILVHHPYESFATSVEEFIAQAAADPDVLAIKQTLYRTSSDSVIMNALMEAAERGKQVVALVELKARFDEDRNITWAQRLEETGVHVVYGVVGLKTHTKITLVVRQEEGMIRRYSHVGTGNYNEQTARIYEDLGLFTCDQEVGADLSFLFNFLTGYSRHPNYRKLLVSPVFTRPRFLQLIASQARPGGQITMKMNSLLDKAMIEALYEASNAGARIDLVVRGICCLVPGVPGMSENIRVRSLVGRYLEHSRVYRFGNREDRVVYYMGSADMMPRNLDSRVEVMVPVEDPDLRFRIDEMFEVLLADDTLAWILGPDAKWTKVEGSRGRVAHLELQTLAEARAYARL